MESQTDKLHNIKVSQRVRWFRLGMALLVFIVLSLGLAYLGQSLLAKLDLSAIGSKPLAYLTIFGIAVVVNLSFLPLPFAVSVMIAAAAKWDPLWVAFFGSLGASIGELSGYYVGLIGKRIAIPDEIRGYQLVRHWIQRYGIWAVAFLSFQPDFQNRAL